MQGCTAWGDTPEQTLDELRAVARALSLSRRKRGVPPTRGNATAEQQGELHGRRVTCRALRRELEQAGNVWLGDDTPAIDRPFPHIYLLSTLMGKLCSDWEESHARNRQWWKKPDG